MNRSVSDITKKSSKVMEPYAAGVAVSKTPKAPKGSKKQAVPSTSTSHDKNKTNRSVCGNSNKSNPKVMGPYNASASASVSKKLKTPKGSKKEEVRSTTSNKINTYLAAKLSSITLDKSKENWKPKYRKFEDMGLNQKLLKGISAYGLEKPVQVQRQAIVPCVEGRDMIIQAQSGMGKTVALVISLLQRIDLSNPQCQVLILTPTKELTEQISAVVSEMGQFLGVSTFACVGGFETKQCQAEVQKGKQIIVGTSGQILLMLENSDRHNFLTLGSLKSIALDEGNQILSRPTSHQNLNEIFERVSPTTQIILTYATMPENILGTTWTFMRKPLKLSVKNEELTFEGIHQYYVYCKDGEGKQAMLSYIFNRITKAQGVIFCNTKQKVTKLSNAMEASGHKVSAMSGDLDQGYRSSIVREFRIGKTASRMLITSDLLGEGIDVQQLNLVINYDLPQKKKEYIHRVGRRGRDGRKGVAITFVTEDELPELKTLEKVYQTEIQQMPRVENLLQFLPSTWQVA